jgi:hypothetical protein
MDPSWWYAQQGYTYGQQPAQGQQPGAASAYGAQGTAAGAR